MNDPKRFQSLHSCYLKYITGIPAKQTYLSETPALEVQPLPRPCGTGRFARCRKPETTTWYPDARATALQSHHRESYLDARGDFDQLYGRKGFEGSNFQLWIHKSGTTLCHQQKWGAGEPCGSLLARFCNLKNGIWKGESIEWCKT